VATRRDLPIALPPGSGFANGLVTTADVQLHVQKLLLLGAFFLGAIFVGLLLAGAPVLLILALGGFAWLLLLPYHAQIATTVAMVTFASGFILPGFPGRPFVWEAAAMLGWTGVAVTIALRQYSAEASKLVRRHWLLFAGALGYCAVLVTLMYFRGVGIRVFGGSQMGGRIYLQQLLCAIFPLLFVLRPMGEERMVKLYVIQCLLSVSFLPADLVFAYGGKVLEPLLYVLDLPNDGVNFENQAMQFGIRRFQSFFFLSLSFYCLLLTWRRFEDYLNRNAIWMWPSTILILGLGLLGGHRNLILFLAFVIVITAWAQRFYTVVRLLGVLLITGLIYLTVATNIREMPLSVQRALSVVPGLDVDRQASDDGQATLEGRRTIRKAGLEVAKDYRWIGRGFGKPKDVSLSGQVDMTQMHVDSGIFYNGTVGLLVNTGLPGTVTMFCFMGAGSWLAFRNLRHVRRHGAEDMFSRMACVLSSLWIGQVFSFVFLHGDAEFAMRTFGIEAGMLLLCDHNLSLRTTAAQQAQAVAEAKAAETPVVVEAPRIRPRLAV
jgi:O-antigen ligase